MSVFMHSEMSDDELERLKRRKMQEMQRRMAQNQTPPSSPTPERKEPTSSEILGNNFGDRAWEVWNAAQQQYPSVIHKVEASLVQAIKEGKVKKKIDGAALAHFFRAVGLPVRLNTQIRFAEHGELKTLEQKLKSEG